MKYHYQFVSPTTVRIELIPDDQKEITLLESLHSTDINDQTLKVLFQEGLEAYAAGMNIKKLNFMNYPKVALVSFEKNMVKDRILL